MVMRHVHVVRQRGSSRVPRNSNGHPAAMSAASTSTSGR